MDTLKYVVCQFVNELDVNGRPKLQVGHTQWLLSVESSSKEDISFTKNQVQRIIDDKKLVQMKWPSNVDSMAVEGMLKKKNVTFRTDVAASLLFQTDVWQEAVTACDNIAEGKDPIISKSDRKKFALRNQVNEDLNAEITVPSTKRKRPSSKSSEKREKKPEPKGQLKGAGYVVNLRNANKSIDMDDSESDEDISLQKYKELKSTAKVGFNLNSSEDSLLNMDTNRGMDLKEKVRLQALEIDMLRKQVAFYKDVHATSNSMPKLRSETNELRRLVGDMIERVKRCTCHKHRSSETKVPKVESKTHSNYSSSIDRKKSESVGSSSIIKEILTVPEKIEMLHQVKKIDCTGILTEQPIENLEEGPLKGLLNSKFAEVGDGNDVMSPVRASEQGPKVKFEEKENSSHVDQDNLDNSVSEQNSDQDGLKKNHNQEETESFGGRRIEKALINKINHSKPTTLATGLMSLVFTSEELALCSMKGKKNNKFQGAIMKKPLDKSVVSAILDYIRSRHKEQDEDALKLAMTNKLSNYCKTDEGKKIIELEKTRQNQLQQETPPPNEGEKQTGQ